MFKSFTIIGAFLVSLQFAEAAPITTATQYVNHIKSLSDDGLIKHLRRHPKALGTGKCSFSQAIASTSCPYRVGFNKSILCFTNHPTLSVVAPVKGSWELHPGASAYADAKAYMNSVRMAATATDAKSRALTFIRNTMLASPSVCNIQIADVQPSISQSFDSFTLSNVKFSKSTVGNRLICSTTQFSPPRWNPATCSYVSAKVYPHADTCKALLNKLSKTTTVGVASAVSPVSYEPFTATIAKEYAVAQLSEAAVSSLPEASNPVNLFDAISPEVMAISENNAAQITALAADASARPLLAQHYKFVTTAPSDIAIHAEAVAIKDQIASYAPVMALTASAAAFDGVAIKATKVSALQLADTQVISTINAVGATAPTTVFNLATGCPMQMMVEAQPQTYQN